LSAVKAKEVNDKSSTTFLDMSTNKSAQSIKAITDSHIESDKIESTASNGTTSSVITKPTGLEEADDKKGNKTFSNNNSIIDSHHVTYLIWF
jgi:hypothetical protein